MPLLYIKFINKMQEECKIYLPFMSKSENRQLKDDCQKLQKKKKTINEGQREYMY